MSLPCAVFGWWSACTEGGGSLAEWATVFVAAAALAAAVWAGLHSASAAKSAREQAESAAKAIEHSSEAASSAQTQADAAVKAAADAGEQTRIAQEAFTADAKVREEAQARLVYSTTVVGEWFPKGSGGHGTKTSVIYDEGQLEAHSYLDQVMRVHAFRLAVTIHNGSQEIVGSYGVRAANARTKARSGHRLYDEPIPPGGSVTHTLVITAEGVDPMKESPDASAEGWVPTIEYRDSAGVRWSRTGSEPIVKIERMVGEMPGV